VLKTVNYIHLLLVQRLTAAHLDSSKTDRQLVSFKFLADTTVMPLH